jgi:hypothetical protein
VVYAKRPFAGPKAVLNYLSRYTHRVAIANSRLVACDEHGVTFKWKDYRAKGRTRHKTMTLAAPEFIRRFLLHVLPSGFHRIRHYGFYANNGRAQQMRRVRQLLSLPTDTSDSGDASDETGSTVVYVCNACSAAMVIIETLPPAPLARAPPRRAA